MGYYADIERDWLKDYYQYMDESYEEELDKHEQKNKLADFVESLDATENYQDIKEICGAV